MKLLYITRRLHRLMASVGLVTALVLGIAVPVFAAGDTGVTITGGTLSGGAVTFADIAPITLSGGVVQTSTASWSFSNIIDARGSGAGWNTSLTLTAFKEWDSTLNAGAGDYVSSGKSLATSSLKVSTAPTVAKVDSTSSDVATITKVTTTTALDTASPVKILTAAVDGGMGSYAVGALGVTLTVPANVYALTYKSDATYSLTTGP